MFNEDLPAFLKRTGPRLTNEEARHLVDSTSGRRREWWMPGKDWKSSQKTMAEVMAAYSGPANPTLPVSVRILSKEGSGTEEVVRYGNWAEYQANHDAKTYPLKHLQEVEGVTVALCTAKPWAGKIKAVPGIDEPSPPTAAQVAKSAPTQGAQRQKRVPDTGLEAAIIAAVGAESTRNEIQAKLIAQGHDATMLQNSLGGRLDRLVKEGRLLKLKEGKRVIFKQVK